MMTRRLLISRLSHSAALALANTADVEVPAPFIGLANEIAVDESGWALIPYGEWGHSGKDGRLENNGPKIAAGGVVQRFTREDAQALVNDFKSVWGRVKRAIVGLPVFKGHPDAPRYAATFPDKTPRGTIADMEARGDGLAVRLALTPQGGDDVESGWKFISPYWDAKPVGLANDGAVKVVAPVKLRSIGLVQKGNIPGLSLTNASENSESSMIKTLLIKLLAAMGVSVAADADETALTSAVDQATSSYAAANAAEISVVENGAEKKIKVSELVPTLQGQLSTAQQQLETLTAEKTALANSFEAEKAARTVAETALQTERKAHATALVNCAILEGRLPASDREATVTALCNSFETESAKLASRRPELKTRSALGNLSTQGKEVQDRQQQVLGLVNAYMEEKGISYEDAFQAVQKDPKHAPLFDAMKKPTAKA